MRLSSSDLFCITLAETLPTQVSGSLADEMNAIGPNNSNFKNASKVNF